MSAGRVVEMVKQSTRGGKQHASSSNTGKKPATVKGKQFHPMSSSFKPRHSYQEVQEMLMDQLRVSGKDDIMDVMESIRGKQWLVMEAPTLKTSSSTDPEVKATETRQNEMDYEFDRKQYMHRKNNLEKNKLYVRGKIITSFVTQEMHEKLKTEADYETELEDPLKFLKRIGI